MNTHIANKNLKVFREVMTFMFFILNPFYNFLHLYKKPFVNFPRFRKESRIIFGKFYVSFQITTIFDWLMTEIFKF